MGVEDNHLDYVENVRYGADLFNFGDYLRVGIPARQKNFLPARDE
jgi:hypothetical protein